MGSSLTCPTATSPKALVAVSPLVTEFLTSRDPRTATRPARLVAVGLLDLPKSPKNLQKRSKLPQSENTQSIRHNRKNNTHNQNQNPQRINIKLPRITKIPKLKPKFVSQLKPQLNHARKEEDTYQNPEMAPYLIYEHPKVTSQPSKSSKLESLLRFPYSS